jgi:hypothetical protein
MLDPNADAEAAREVRLRVVGDDDVSLAAVPPERVDADPPIVNLTGVLIISVPVVVDKIKMNHNVTSRSMLHISNTVRLLERT